MTKEHFTQVEAVAMALGAGGVQLFTPSEFGANGKTKVDVHISMTPDALERFAKLARADLPKELDGMEAVAYQHSAHKGFTCAVLSYQPQPHQTQIALGFISRPLYTRPLPAQDHLPLSEKATLMRERNGWREEAEQLQKRLRFSQADNDLLRCHAKKEVWYWQGDGSDYLESLVNNVAVVIHAADLRTLIAAKQGGA